MKILIYTIVNIADIHWGVLEPSLQEDRLEYLLIFLDLYRHIDLLVISGDFWDEKEPLNSTPALSGINWFHRLITKAHEVGIKAVRLVKGTVDHDFDQLEAFRGLEDNSGFFKIFNNTTSEETLSGLHCIYCPDETLNNDDYIMTYINLILKGHDIGFFHGSFDVVFKEISVNIDNVSHANNVIYQYSLWSKLIKGPMLSGHWHNGKKYGHLYYSGSPDRWAFDEDEPKGFSFIQYDTETGRYFHKRILNCLSPEYLTYEVYTNVYTSIELYNSLIHNIQKKLDEFKDNIYQSVKIRILIYINNESSENDTYITSLRQYFINEKRVKIQIKNKIKDKKKRDETQHNSETNSKFGFIHDRSKSTAQIIQQYILVTRNKEIPIDMIEPRVNKYITHDTI
jgi:hypothetical protein